MSDKESSEKMVIEVPGNNNVRKEIISYHRSGKIDYNYQIESNFFTSEKKKHNKIIGIWEEEYGNEDNKSKFKIMKVISKKSHLKKQSVAGLSCKKGSRKVLNAFLLCYVEDGENVNYGSLKGRVIPKGIDNEVIEKIKRHPEELAAAIFSKSHNIQSFLNRDYNYEKTINDFTSKSSQYEQILEIWYEEYGQEIKKSLNEKNNYTFIKNINDKK
ncbi:21620_t:CDS:2, partial [Racocetra persica]